MSIYEGIMAGLKDALAYERREENGCVVHEVDDERMHNRRQKISRSKPPKKSKHKHRYEPCVFEFNGMRFSKERGVIYDQPEKCISAYCPVCGKVGPLPDSERWYVEWRVYHLVYSRMIEPTDECKRELNPETRTLPTFFVEDPWFTKYVDIGDSSGSNC